MPNVQKTLLSHWVLKILLRGNAVLSAMWIFCYLFHNIFWVEALNIKLLWLLLVAFAGEVLLFYAGNAINLCSCTAVYWMIFFIVPCVQMPAMVYLRWYIGPNGAWMHILWNADFLIICLQSIASLVYHQRCRN